MGTLWRREALPIQRDQRILVKSVPCEIVPEEWILLSQMGGIKVKQATN